MIPRATVAVLRTAVRAHAPAAVACRAASTWLQGKPPAVDQAAGTIAAFYYAKIREAAIPTKDHMVAVGQDEKFTVAQFDKQVYGYARGMLEALGLKKGDTIATWMTNELEHLVVLYAAGLLGVRCVTIDPSLGWETVLKTIPEQSVRALILSPRYKDDDRFGALADVFDAELTPITRNPGYSPMESKRFRSLKYVVCTSNEYEDGIVRFKELPVYGLDGEYETDDIAVVQSYLSKSDAIFQPVTAAGLGAARSHSELIATATAAAKAAGMGATDTVVTTAPLHTPTGFTAGALAAAGAGAKTVVPGKSFDAAGTLAAITAQGATVLITTPAHAAALSAELAKDEAKGAKRAYNVSTLRSGIVVPEQAGAAAPAAATVGSVALKPLA